MNSFLMGNNFQLPQNRLGNLKDSMLPGAISALGDPNLQSGNYELMNPRSNLASGSLLMVPMASFKGRGLTSIAAGGG